MVNGIGGQNFGQNFGQTFSINRGGEDPHAKNFRGLDTDRNGKLGGAELDKLAQGLSKVTGQDITRERLLKGDKDGDGSLNPSEMPPPPRLPGSQDSYQSEGSGEDAYRSSAQRAIGGTSGVGASSSSSGSGDPIADLVQLLGQLRQQGGQSSDDGDDLQSQLRQSLLGQNYGSLR